MSNYKNDRIDFGETTGGQDWMIVNDTVMGGLSNSEMTLTQNSLVFKGELSLKNNGGFASIRSSNQKFDLSKYKIARIKFRSNDREFALRFASSDLFYKPNYKHSFGPSNAEWKTVELELSNFKEYRKGQIIDTDVTKDELENVIRVGVIISDKKEGPFEIEIDYIEFE